MKMMLMLTMLTTSATLTVSKHPLSMGLVLMIQTLLTSMMVGIIMKSFWFSYMVFIILLGGVLILFMYMASIASNEKMKFSMKMLMTIMSLMAVSIYISMNTDSMLMEEMTYNNTNIIKNEQSISLIKLFNTQTLSITIMMVTYLLLTMIIITNIVSVFEGPMRKKS